MNTSYDVCIIGGGVVGCAIARELSRYELSIVLLEKQSDISEGTTKANSAIVHSGYDAKPGTKKAEYNVKGSKIFEQWCLELDVPYRCNTSLVLSFEQQGLTDLEKLLNRGKTNGVEGLSIINRNQLIEREPLIGTQACHALLAEKGAICSPYDLTIRLAEHSVVNGVEIVRNCFVSAVTRTEKTFLVETSIGKINSRIIVNAAGVYADQINNQISEDKFKIIARRGEYWMLDKACGPVFDATIFQLPTKMGKGVLITPTVEGTIIIGPSAEDIEDKDDVSTTENMLEHILKVASRSWQNIPRTHFITAFAGLRAHCDRDDFIIGSSKDIPGYYLAAGIESPGLTAAPAIAIDLANQIALDAQAVKKSDFNPPPKAMIFFRDQNNDARSKLINENSQYGHIICRCEQVSEAEIRQAVKRPVGATTVDGVKRRTRAGMGRCQGGFCLPHVLKILSEETGIPFSEITKMGGASKIITGRPGGILDEHQD